MIILISGLTFLLVMTVSYVIINNVRANNPMTLRFKTIENMVERRSDVEEVLSKSFSERVLLPMGRKFENRFKALTPNVIRQFVEKRLIRAGGFHGLTNDQFIAVNVILIICLLLANLLISILLKFKIMQVVTGIIYAIIVGLVGPYCIISRKIAVRQSSMQKDLPNTLDLITISVEAGLSFDGAIAKLVEKMKGALVDEFGHALQEMRMGITRRDAMKDMERRCSNKDISIFVAALVQADQLGVSLGSMLRIQAGVIRESRKQFIEEKATKAPVHMLFPLVFCIMPTLFIVILGPAVLKIVTQFFK